MVVTAVTQGATAASVMAMPASIPASETNSTINFHASYVDSARERALERSQSADVIVQLKSNLAQLEDLHARVRFVMSEIGYLLKATGDNL